MDTLSPIFAGHLKPMSVFVIALAGVALHFTLFALLKLNSRGEVGGDGGDGGESTTGLESLPDEIKTDPNISKYKNVGELVKGHLEAVKLIGSKGVIIPKDDAPKEDWDKFHNTLGRPADPKGYKFTPLEKMHSSIKVSPETEGAFRSFAHGIGLTNKQADELNKWYLTNVSKQLTDGDELSEKAINDAKTALRNEWGSNFDKNISLASKVVEKFGGKEAVGAINLESNPLLLKMMASIGMKMSEDSILKGDGQSDGTVDAAGALKKIKEINSDQKHPYWVLDDPKHDEAIEEMKKLYETAYGGSQ